MVSQELLAILVCPFCRSKVDLVEDSWLVCENPECHRKYPVKDSIPVMLVEEGTKWKDTDTAHLPDPQGLQF